LDFSTGIKRLYVFLTYIIFSDTRSRFEPFF